VEATIMFKDVNGLMSGDGFGEPFDPAMISWGLFENSGNPCYYLLYKDLLESEEDKDKFE
jgi:hypothetical protein